MNIGVVTVTHNNTDDIAQAIRSALVQGIKNIVVVDNASSDDTQGIISRLPVKVLCNESNEGFASAANTGAQMLNTEYILFLNPDTQLHDSIRSAVDYLSSHRGVAVLGLSLRSERGNIEKYSFGGKVTPVSMVTRWFQKFLVQESSLKNPMVVGWVSGGAMIVRRSVFDEIGGFDPRFFMYWEDVDFCRRIADGGHTVVYFPTVQVYHRRGSSLRDNREKARLYDESADRYLRKYYPSLICLVLRYIRHLFRFLSPLAR